MRYFACLALNGWCTTRTASICLWGTWIIWYRECFLREHVDLLEGRANKRSAHLSSPVFVCSLPNETNWAANHSACSTLYFWILLPLQWKIVQWGGPGIYGPRPGGWKLIRRINWRVKWITIYKSRCGVCDSTGLKTKNGSLSLVLTQTQVRARRRAREPRAGVHL